MAGEERLISRSRVLFRRQPSAAFEEVSDGSLGDRSPNGSAVTNPTSFLGESGHTWRYWTDQCLGSPGSFGEVFAAEADDGSPKAVKRVAKLRPGLVLDERLLRREVAIGKKVNEGAPNGLLLPVIDAAEDKDALFLVLDRAESSLAQAMLPMSESDLIARMVDIATGLTQLHGLGIIHRDLKPANILKKDGKWMLADFGIARDEEVGTQSVTFLGWGSAGYMAPELWELKSPTARTDLYALGCLAFELLTGSCPYVGDESAVREGHLSGAVPAIATVNPILQRLLTRLLHKSPGARPQDARAVLESLERIPRTRTHIQEAVAQSLAVHESELAKEEMERAIARAEARALSEQRQLAQADLNEILADGLDLLHQVDADIEIKETRDGITISNAVATVLFEVWEPELKSLNRTDTMVLAGGVVLSGRRLKEQLLAANIVYEQIDDRLKWRLYAFLPGVTSQPGRYHFGPYGRPHGLKRKNFFDPRNRDFMIQAAGMHYLKIAKKAQLTDDEIQILFNDAVRLR